MRRVVITGYGAISPIGLNAKENWESLIAGKSGIRPITLFDTEGYRSKIAGEISAYDSKAHFSGKDLKKMDRFIQFCMVAAKEAIEDSGIDISKEDPSMIGSCVGVGMGGLPEIQKQYDNIRDKGPSRVSPFFIPAIIPNLAAGHIAIKYGFKGPNLCTATACSSSAHAIGESVRMIQREDVDVMVSGGTEAVICELALAGFASARALSTRNSEPEKASRPFDKDRDGFVIGEGACVLVLESLDHAKKRGAKLFAEVIGYAATCDAFHITSPTADGEGAYRCMKKAIENAGISPDKIDYINAHGTSTPVGDRIESLAVKRLFGAAAKDVCMSSTKSMTGHLLGAAGAIEAMYCVLALQNNTVPPTINLDNPEGDLNYVPNETQKKNLDIVMSNSFGFGGTNATLLLKKYNG